MKTYTVNALTGAGLDELIRAIEAEKKRLAEGVPKLVQKAAGRGRELAQANFAEAQYDGTHGQDNVIVVPGNSENEAAVRAEGPTAAFIEFGTGVVYPDNYPEAVGRGMRGTFGNRQGKNPKGWHYKGDEGSNGSVEPDGKWKGWVHTYGNPANAPVYRSREKLLEQTQELVAEVFEGRD